MSDSKSVPKLRLDDLLLEKGLADSKTQAQALIMAGKVFCGTQRLDKSGKKVDVDLDVRVEAPPRFVSRGGEKLEGILTATPSVRVLGASCLDVGASTGGFTDCLLQHGARQVVCVDVGHGQLHEKLRRDPRVKSFEGINAREMSAEILPRALFDIVVMDLAFISQRKVLENVWRFVDAGGVLLSLIKPQFEVSKQEADRCQGVIKDDMVRMRVVKEVRAFAKEKLPGLTEENFITSPIEGTEGNREFLVCWRKSVG